VHDVAVTPPRADAAGYEGGAERGEPQVSSDDEVTLGELRRRLSDLQAAMHDLVNRMDRDYVRASELERIRMEFDRRVGAVESTWMWVGRTFGAVIIAALLGIIATKGQLG